MSSTCSNCAWSTGSSGCACSGDGTWFSGDCAGSVSLELSSAVDGTQATNGEMDGSPASGTELLMSRVKVGADLPDASA